MITAETVWSALALGSKWTKYEFVGPAEALSDLGVFALTELPGIAR